MKRVLIVLLLIVSFAYSQDMQRIIHEIKVHNSVNTIVDETLLSGVRTTFICDGATYEYIVGGSMWSDSIVHDSYIGNRLMLKFKVTLNCAQVNKCVTYEIVIDSEPEIPVDYGELWVYKQGVDVNFTAFSLLYIGAEAMVDGFKIYLTSNNDMTISDKSILITE